jgi:hypothetical protein
MSSSFKRNSTEDMNPDQLEALDIVNELTLDLTEFSDNDYCFIFKMKCRLKGYKDKAKFSKRQLYDLRKLKRKRENESAHSIK